jgi:protein N-terminal amidase
MAPPRLCLLWLVLVGRCSAVAPIPAASPLDPLVGGKGGEVEWALRLSSRISNIGNTPLSAATLLADWRDDKRKYQMNATTSRVLRGPSARGVASLAQHSARPLMPQLNRANLTLAVLQMQAEHGRVNESMAKATRLLEEAPIGSIDLLVLPELAFTGYIWDTPHEAALVAEPIDGPTYQWAANVAQTRSAYVLLGFVEDAGDVLHNSAMMVGPTGELFALARKTALTNTDAQWAASGSGSKSMPIVDLPGVGRVGIGICKDISAVPQNAVPGQHVMDDSFSAAAVDIIAVLAAWDSTDSSDVVHSKWMARVGKHIGTQTLLVVADQSGFELGTPYAGSSTIMDLSEPTILAGLNTDSEGVVVHHVLDYPLKAMRA